MNHPFHTVSWALALCTSLAACGGSTVSAIADDAPPSGEAPATAPVTLPTPPAEEPAPARVTGDVFISQWQESAGTHPQVWASLWRTEGRSLARGCRTTVVAGCEVRRCDPGVEREATPSSAVVSAGEMHLDGLAVGGITLRPRPDPWYGVEAPAALATRARAWTGGEHLSLRADGDPNGAPAFALDLVAPAPIQVLSPTLDGRRLARGVDDLTVAWTGRGDGVVRVQLGEPQAEGETVRLRCDYPLRDGRATVPAAALAEVRGVVNLFVLSIATTRVRTDDVDLSFSLKHVGRVDQVEVE